MINLVIKHVKSGLRQHFSDSELETFGEGTNTVVYAPK